MCRFLRISCKIISIAIDKCFLELYLIRSGARAIREFSANAFKINVFDNLRGSLGSFRVFALHARAYFSGQ